VDDDVADGPVGHCRDELLARVRRGAIVQAAEQPKEWRAHVRVKALAVALRQEAIRRALAMRCTAYSWRSVPEPYVSRSGRA
jgi:hypothetical protein